VFSIEGLAVVYIGSVIVEGLAVCIGSLVVEGLAVLLKLLLYIVSEQRYIASCFRYRYP